MAKKYQNSFNLNDFIRDFKVRSREVTKFKLVETNEGDFVKDIEQVKQNVTKNMRKEFNVVFWRQVTKFFPNNNEIFSGMDITGNNPQGKDDGGLHLDQQKSTTPDRNGLQFQNFQMQVNDGPGKNDIAKEIYDREHQRTTTIACVLIPYSRGDVIYRVPNKLIRQAFAKSLEAGCNYKIVPE